MSPNNDIYAKKPKLKKRSQDFLIFGEPIYLKTGKRSDINEEEGKSGKSNHISQKNNFSIFQRKTRTVPIPRYRNVNRSGWLEKEYKNKDAATGTSEDQNRKILKKKEKADSTIKGHEVVESIKNIKKRTSSVAETEAKTVPPAKKQKRG